MNIKQKFLTGFPTTLFGSSRPSAQALFRKRHDELTKKSIGSLSLQFQSILPAQSLERLASSAPQRVTRERIYSSTVTFWAWIGQALDRNSSCSSAVSMIQAWRLEEGLDACSSDTGSYTRARQRLPSTLVTGASREVIETMEKRIRTEDLWHGLQVKSIDGSTSALLDTEENQKQYPQHSNQKAGCGHPLLKFVAVLNHAHGAWEGHVTAHPRSSDALVMRQLYPHFQAGSLCVADGAFCSYESFARLQAQGAQALMRLHGSKKKAFQKKDKKCRGDGNYLIEWKKPTRKPKTLDLTDEQWADLPETMTVRYLLCKHRGRDGKRKTSYFVTTLTDIENYSGEELMALYFERWEIELRLRDLKTTMNLEELRVKTPELARKALAMGLLAFNLVKALHQESAHRTGTKLHQLSFTGTLEVLQTTRSWYRGRKSQPNKLASLLEEILALIITKKIKPRPNRWEPRRRKKRAKAYDRLIKPRCQYHQDYSDATNA